MYVHIDNGHFSDNDARQPARQLAVIIIALMPFVLFVFTASLAHARDRMRRGQRVPSGKEPAPSSNQSAHIYVLCLSRYLASM